MPSVYVRLNMGVSECLEFYTSQAPNARTHTVDGRSIIFPRRLLRNMVDSNGIHGLFRITYNDQGQFVSIERVST
ncbi:DUF2835 family protein [Marinospirillum sp.]|uniref:DUF2835 family protein n=1 Tax=Marinospirillum sp. TaxID=2183934 RepID=UPI002870B27F|nr:DUF2835 family protein [Marinospirillum sp.]MDR9468662.1 DUF2835 family protein [Marinospirillum sp.]